MYILLTEQDGNTYYWLGKGFFTLDLNQAKQYKTWEAADKACNRIKRWKMKINSVEEELYHLQAINE